MWVQLSLDKPWQFKIIINFRLLQMTKECSKSVHCKMTKPRWLKIKHLNLNQLLMFWAWTCPPVLCILTRHILVNLYFKCEKKNKRNKKNEGKSEKLMYESPKLEAWLELGPIHLYSCNNLIYLSALNS